MLLSNSVDWQKTRELLQWPELRRLSQYKQQTHIARNNLQTQVENGTCDQTRFISHCVSFFLSFDIKNNFCQNYLFTYVPGFRTGFSLRNSFYLFVKSLYLLLFLWRSQCFVHSWCVRLIDGLCGYSGAILYKKYTAKNVVFRAWWSHIMLSNPIVTFIVEVCFIALAVGLPVPVYFM